MAGGGSLNLIKFVAQELNLEEGDITGTWDIAHQLQLIWNRALKKNPKVKAVIKVFFDAMSDFSLGKDAAILHNKAREMQTLILSSKSYQETRFVRSILRGLGSGLRNLPTMAMVFQEEYDLAALEMRNSDAKVFKNKLDSLKEPKTILEAVGVCQLLEIYGKTSLEAQYTKHFPTQVWKRVKEAEAELVILAEKWEWSEKELTKASLESPKVILDRLKTEGKYVPKLKREQVICRQEEMRDSGLLADGKAWYELFEYEEQVVPLAGEVIMEKETTDKIVESVEKELQGYARSVLEEFQKRLIQPPLQTAASSLFSDDSEDQTIMDPEETEPELWSKEKKVRYEKLENLVQLLPNRQSQKFSPALIFGGLESYLLFSKQQREEDEGAQEDKIYRDWFKKNVKCENALESSILFSKLFQNLQIRSTSEVILLHPPHLK